MYAEGDGLAKDDIKAFEMFSEVADAHADDNPAGSSARSSPMPSWRSAPITARAFRTAPSSRISAVPGRCISYAASYFGDSDAQLKLARMYYDGEGGERDPRQAVRWAKLAANKGNVGAQALLGHMLFEGEGVNREPVLGLMYLTVARDRSRTDDGWIRKLQEQAFSVATETERRTALALADDWMNKNMSTAAQ